MDCFTCGLVDKFRDLVLDFSWEQLCYLIYYHKNMEQFNEQLEQLTNKRISIQNQKEEAENNVLQVEEEVLRWLSNVDEISEKVQKLLEKNREKEECSIRSCPNPWMRYQLSKTAKEMAQQISETLAKANFSVFAHHVPPPLLIELPTGVSNAGIDSRVQIKSQIIEALQDPSVRMVGLCGLGGVGKTTIAIDVAKEEEILKQFNKVIMTTVSQEKNIGKIQDQIIDKLGMQLDVKDEEVKAFHLRERLKQEKNMLLILDDLWEELELNKVGIPFVDINQNSKNEGCKILLTSRQIGLLSNHMKCQEIINVVVLSEDEAWELFERIVAVSIDSSIKSIARKIVQKCGGLPLAIATAAKALKENLNKEVWKDYLARLNHPLTRTVTGIKEVDAILRLSYDDLSKEKKQIFLVAAMMSHDPLIEDLLMYSVGLDILEHAETMAHARGVIFDVVRKLKSLNLFLDSFSMHHFTIHDVYRDLALSIASDELKAVIVRHRRLNVWPDEDKLEHCRGICLQESGISDLPEELHGPMLELFLLDSEKDNLAIPNMFFKSSKKLKLLALTNVNFSSLASLKFLEKLKALCLHSCVLEDITEVRSLRKLKVLSLAHSTIEELPIELAELTSLQMLNLSNCSKLKVIPQKILSKLKKLEVLYMSNSFDRWNDKQSIEANENTSLDELSDLPISSLDIHIPKGSMLPENLFLHMKLERYKMLIGEHWEWWHVNDKSSKILRLEQENGFHLTDGVQKLLIEVEDLRLYGSNGHENVMHNQDGRGFPCLKHLRIESNDDIKYIALNSTHQETVFPILETLKLQNLKVLENLCEGRDDVVEFLKLHTLKMENLPALTGDISLKLRATNSASNKLFKSLFSNKVLFPKLEILELSNLNKLISVIWDDQISHNSFNNLRTITVERCGFEKLVPYHVLKSLNNLEEVTIVDCDMLETVFDFENLNDNEDIVSLPVVVPLKNLTLRSLPKLKNVCSNHYYQGNVSFSSLKSVNVSNCESLTSIFPASIAKDMRHNLEELSIYNCGIEVIFAKDQTSESVAVTFEFLKLTSFRLDHLSKLRNFYPHKHKLELSCLQELSIKHCDELEIFEKEISSSSGTYEEKTTIDLKYPLIHNSFINLKTLIVKSCNFIKSVPIRVLKSLNNLEKLEVSDCDKLEVFGNEDLNDYYKEIESSSAVVPLSIKHLKVKWCNGLTTLMTPSTARCLVHLTHLKVSRCDQIEEIITKDEGGDNEDKEILFTDMAILELHDLPRLKSFCGYNYAFRFPLLKQVTITQCLHLTVFCTGDIHAPCLRSIQVDYYHIWKTDLNNTIQHRYTFPEVITTTRNMLLNAKNIKTVENVFPEVSSLFVESFKDEGITFPFRSLERFPMMYQLYVEHSSFEEIFPSQDEISAFEGEIPSFTELYIAYLDKLKNIWKDDFQLPPIHQNLLVIQVKSCCNLNKLAPSNASFKNLWRLSISGCHKLIYLVTISTAKSLVSLGRLEIHDCHEMEEIVMNETNEDVEGAITFNKLWKIELTDMPSLIMFSKTRHSFEFPELEEIKITGCPKIKMLCPGRLETTKLSEVIIEEHAIEMDDGGDLNKVIQEHSYAKVSPC